MEIRNILFFAIAMTSIIHVGFSQNPADAQRLRQQLEGNQRGGQSGRNVDRLNLTDAEANQYWLRAQSLGYALEEIPDLARNQGFTDRQAVRLYQQIVRLQAVAASQGLTVPYTTPLEQDSVEVLRMKKRIFGMSVFDRAFLTSFIPNVAIATPKSYVLGPNDRVRIEIYGTSQRNYNLQIEEEGYVRIPQIGPVMVAGLDIEEATKKINENLSKIYRGMIGPNPTVFTNITLSEIRTIKVSIVGEVLRPGNYQIPAFSGVFNALYGAGGITVNGTFRKVKVYRDGIQQYSVDIYKFLVDGDDLSQYTLNEGDIIVVETYSKRIEVRGEVRRPGLFEISDGDSLDRILFYAGKFTANAFKESLLLERYNGEEQFVNDISMSNPVLNLEDGDIITIRRSTDLFVEKLQVDGAVSRPGVYAWQQGITISQLIERSGGLVPGAIHNRISVYRFNDDLSSSSFTVDLENDPNTELEIGDVIKVPRKEEVIDTRYIQVSGEINNPGVFPFYEGSTVADAILLAGGVKNAAVNGQIEIARRTYENNIPTFEVIPITIPGNLSDSSLNLIEYQLEPLDHVFIRPAPGYQKGAIVSVQGEVQHPGDYVITSSDMRLSDLISRAGGFTNYAFAEGVALLRPVNGDNDKDLLKERIDRLTELKKRINDPGSIYQSSTSTANLRVLNERIETLRMEYEKEYLLNEDGIRDFLALDVSGGRRGVDRIGIDVIDLQNNPGGPNDLVLLPGDILEIPRQQETVKIRGAVQYPTSTKFIRAKGFRSYISQAGGFSPTARPGRSYVIYANGDAKKVRQFIFFRKYPEIRPGSSIVVAGGRVRQPFNAERVLALTTSALTTYLFVQSFIEQQNQ